MSIEIIELRQKDSLNVMSNGVYENTLNGKTIEVNDGDVISIKNVFLDTTQQNQFTFENDVNLTIKFGMYMVDWRSDTKKKNYEDSIPSQSGEPRYLTGETYLPYKTTIGEPLDPNKYEVITEIIYNVKSGANAESAISFTFLYIDFNGVQSQITRTYPYNPPITSPFVNQTNNTIPFGDSNLQLIVEKGTFLTAPQSQQNVEDLLTELTPIELVLEPTPTIDEYAPYVFTKEVLFPSGVYSPSELSLKLGELLTTNFIASKDNKAISNVNPFLRVIRDFDNFSPNPDGTPGAIAVQTFFYNTDLTSRFQYDVQDNDWIGASQVDFNFDQESQKFQIVFIHTPQYDSDTGNQISVRYLCEGSEYPNFGKREGPVYTVGKHAGIYFNELTSNDSITGNKTTFWEDLGFDLTKLCVTPIREVKQIFDINGFVTNYNLIDGVNTTNAFIGMDTTVLKGVTTWFQRPTVPTNTDAGALISTVEATTVIDAQLSIPQIQTPFSHYLIDLNLGFVNNYTDANTIYKNISSVVSRYYSYGSYLSDQQGSINYTHKGAPLYIRSGKIRVLTADKSTDNNLSDDNTIIVQIIKSS